MYLVAKILCLLADLPAMLVWDAYLAICGLLFIH